MQTLSGRTCVFNGANGGDGIAAVKALCAGGMNVVMTTHFPERAKVLSEEIKASGAPGECTWLCGIRGQGPAEANDANYRELMRRYGSVDVIICNSGSNGVMDSIETMTPDDFQKGVEHYTIGTYDMMRAALPYLRQSKHPRIIFMTTTEGCNGGTYESLANAVGKGAVRSMTLNCAARLAKDGITVNCISKGVITRIEPRGADEPDLAAKLPLIPLGRLGGPEDLANAICFLASEESSYITGQIIELSGGLNLGR